LETQKATDALGLIHEEKDFHWLKSLIHHSSSSLRKLAATAMLSYARSSSNVPVSKNIMGWIAKEEAVERADSTQTDPALREKDHIYLKALLGATDAKQIQDEIVQRGKVNRVSEEVLMKLGAILRESNGSFEEKRRALRILEFIPCQKVADLLFHLLAGEQDHAVRFMMIRALNRAHDREPNIRINRFLVKSEIVREVQIYEQLENLRRFYSHRVTKGEESYLAVALDALRDESGERIFHFLDLLYPFEIIQTIHENISKPQDPSLKVKAIELLNNTLESYYCFIPCFVTNNYLFTSR